MPSGEGNAGERRKITIGLISKKAHFFCTFLCRCCAWLQRENSRNILITRFLAEMSLLLIFTLHWVAANISHFITAATKFSCCSPLPKKYIFCFCLSRFRPLLPFFLLSCAGLPRTFSFSLSFSCSVFQICEKDNWSIKHNEHRYRNNFHFPFSSSLTL